MRPRSIAAINPMETVKGHIETIAIYLRHFHWLSALVSRLAYPRHRSSSLFVLSGSECRQVAIAQDPWFVDREQRTRSNRLLAHP